IGETWDGFVQLIAAYLTGQHGFTARRAMERTDDMSDYDHLSRYGEWSAADPAQRMMLGDA
ncbi:MAG TPA: hypothetical protein PLL33_08250, partial [Paracoccus sp. (in: a-proteobacteria)]|nr:hypothetical protein [Paracoccus sp. (in: a-proteobacteria)]